VPFAGLPAGYSARRPTIEDAEAILVVVHAAERDAFGRDDSTLAEVRELLRLPRTPPETDQC
jgi:mycothiol synthase